MGEAEINKSRGVCSTALFLNWMGDKSERDQEDKSLELSLGLPGGGRRAACRDKGKHPAVDGSVDLSLGYSNSQGKANGSPEAEPPATRNALAPTNNNSSQTRSPGAPVVGWPPVRASRRNLATSSKAALEQQNVKKVVKAEETKRAPFVKINMDAQNDPGTKECHQEELAISGLLDGTGEYTLVYEDYEGDRVLVGDVPWGMFVSSAKRLRVLRTSDLSSSLITSSRKRTAADC